MKNLPKSEIIVVMDYYFSETLGGAEINAESLISRFHDLDYKVEKIRCIDITLSYLEENKDKIYIFSNFILLKPKCKQYAIDNLSYFVFEQDHKYLKSRNPIGYKDFIAPKDQLNNLDFYRSAVRVLLLTKLAMDVFVANTGLSNVLNLTSSIWKKPELEFLKKICNNPKNDKIAILDSNNPVKRRADCVRYCRSRDLNHELIKDKNFNNFMFKMSKFKKLVFLTGHLETCARIVVEAKMLNLKVIMQKKLIGAASEDWFSLSGEALIDEMEKISCNAPLRIIETLSE